MFTAAFLSSILQMAVPAMTAIISVGLSKYLERKEKPELAMLVRYLPLAGLLAFYLVPMMDKLFTELTNTLDLSSLSAPSFHQVPDVPQVPRATPQPMPGKFHVDLPYIDYKPETHQVNMTPLHKEINNWTAQMAKPSMDIAKNLPQADTTKLWGHLWGVLDNSWGAIKDIILR